MTEHWWVEKTVHFSDYAGTLARTETWEQCIKCGRPKKWVGVFGPRECDVVERLIDG